MVDTAPMIAPIDNVPATIGIRWVADMPNEQKKYRKNTKEAL